MRIKGTEDYSQEELVAGFCLVDTKTLPIAFTEQLLSVLAVHGDAHKRVDREKLISRLKTELGGERYERRFQEFLEDAVRGFAYKIIGNIKEEVHFTQLSIYTSGRMHRVKLALILNCTFTESRIKRQELIGVFKELMHEELVGKEESYISNRIINVLEYDGWGIS